MNSYTLSALEALDDTNDDINTLIHKFIVFRLGREEYALEALYVSEIVGMQFITIVPNVEQHIRGVINLRGKIIPVLDVRVRFGLSAKEYNDRTCIIICRHERYGTTGLIVDAVVEVSDITPDSITEPPKTIKGNQSKFLQGMAKHGELVRMIVSIDNLLASEYQVSDYQVSEH